MEQLFVVLLGVLILLTSTIFSAARKFLERSRARKARRSVSASSGGSDADRQRAVNNEALGIAPHKPAGSRARASLSALPAHDVIEKELASHGQMALREQMALRDQMRIDGATPGEVEQYRADAPGAPAADATAPAVNAGKTTVSPSSNAISRIRSLPPLKQAIVWSEILSKPLAERDPARSNGFHD